MITKAVVEELVSPYEVRVRIPIFDGADDSPFATKFENLHVATISTLPNCTVNLQVGDIVFVAFEDQAYNKVVVLGYLSKEAFSDTYSDIVLRGLTAKGSANLPFETNIGEVSPIEISHLSGVTSNIQRQISALKERQDKIFYKLFPEEVEV